MSSSIVLDEHKKQRLLLQGEPWYHHSMSRKMAESLVRVGGDFLIRESPRNPGVFVLTGKWNGQPFHLIVHCSGEAIHSASIRFVYFFEDHKRGSVAELIRFHWANQVPMSRKSEAIICRPVHYTRGSLEVALFHPPYSHKSRCRVFARRGHASRPNIPGLSASLNDLADSVSSTENLIDRLGASVQDLPNETYVDPNLSVTHLTRFGVASQDVTKNELSFDHPSLVQGGSQVLPTTLAVPPNANSPKLSSLNRKQIRYVQMHESPSITSTLTDGFGTKSRSKCPTGSGECNHEHCYGSATGVLTFDLTPPLADELVSRIGSVHRALSPDVWKRLSLLFSTRSFAPFDCARHLSATSVHLLTSLKCAHLTEASAVSTPLTQIRDHILVRDRYYHIFVIATILFAGTLEARALVVIFWLDVAQCLRSILRDQHTLNFVRSALLSSQITLLSRLWDYVQRNCSRVSAAMLHAWREGQSEQDTLQKAHDSVTLSSDFENDIPNLIPFLRHLPKSDATSESLNACGDFLAIFTSLPMDFWMRRLTFNRNAERQPLLVCLSQTQTVLSLLLGPIKLESASELDTLAVKLERVLTEIAALSATPQSNRTHTDL